MSSYQNTASLNWETYESSLAGSSPYRLSGNLSLPSDPSSTIAANNVFISADILNINGRIQSGLSDLSVTILNSDISGTSVTQARASYNQAVVSGQDTSSLKYHQLTGRGSDLSEIDSFLI